MPINVAYEPDPRLLADAAFRIGRGNAYLRERTYGDEREQEGYNRQQEAYKRWWEQQQEEERRRQQLFENERATNQDAFAQDREGYDRYADQRNFYEPSWAQEDASRGRQETRDDAWAHWQAQIDWQREQDLNRQISFRKKEEAVNNGKWTYSAAQQQRQSQLLQEIDALRRDDTVEDWQKEDELNKRYDEYQQIIAAPEKFEPNQQPAAQQVFDQSIVTAPDGKRYISQPASNGAYKFEPLDTGEAETAKEQAKLRTTIIQESLKQTIEQQKAAAESLAPFNFQEAFSQNFNALQSVIGGANGIAQPAPVASHGIAQDDTGAAANAQARQAQLDQLERDGQEAVARGDKETFYRLKAQREALLNGG